LGNHEESVRDFDLAIRWMDKDNDDDCGGFLFNRGVVKIILGRYEAAIPDFQKALEYDHPNPDEVNFRINYCKKKIGKK
jgi:tetratricopeptide (TPR) repeat protein